MKQKEMAKKPLLIVTAKGEDIEAFEGLKKSFSCSEVICNERVVKFFSVSYETGYYTLLLVNGQKQY